jgi:hypothetical protein
VPIVYQILQGDNTNHSYDQFLQGMLANKSFDFYIMIEDDYYIHPSNINFENDLVENYKQRFPDNIGYLGSLAGWHPLKECQTGKIWQISIPEGMISKETLFALGENILQHFYNISMYPQLKFNWIFYEKNIRIEDIAFKYKAPFWNSPTQEIIDLSTNKLTNKYFFVPVQLNC